MDCFLIYIFFGFLCIWFLLRGGWGYGSLKNTAHFIFVVSCNQVITIKWKKSCVGIVMKGALFHPIINLLKIGFINWNWFKIYFSKIHREKAMRCIFLT